MIALKDIFYRWITLKTKQGDLLFSAYTIPYKADKRWWVCWRFKEGGENFIFDAVKIESHIKDQTVEFRDPPSIFDQEHKREMILQLFDYNTKEEK